MNKLAFLTGYTEELNKLSNFAEYRARNIQKNLRQPLSPEDRKRNDRTVLAVAAGSGIGTGGGLVLANYIAPRDIPTAIGLGALGGGLGSIVARKLMAFPPDKRSPTLEKTVIGNKGE